MASGNHSLCVDLPIFNDDKTFCNIKKLWQPRISENAAFAACVVPSVFAWLIILFVIYHIHIHLSVIYKYELQRLTSTPKETLKEKNKEKDLSEKQNEVEENIQSLAKNEDSNGNDLMETTFFTGNGEKSYKVNKSSPEKVTGRVTARNDGCEDREGTMIPNGNTDEYTQTDMNFIENELPKKKPCDDVIGKSNSDEKTIESESNNKVNNEKNIPGNNPPGKNTIAEEATLKLDKCYSEQRSQVRLQNVSKKIYLVFTIIILTILKLLWEAIDVTIDAYLFYQIETGRVIDKDIYRNKHVNNAILAFSILECLKVMFWIRFVGVGLEGGMKDLRTSKGLSMLKLYFVAGTFLFEDGPELILEYF